MTTPTQAEYQQQNNFGDMTTPQQLNFIARRMLAVGTYLEEKAGPETSTNVLADRAEEVKFFNSYSKELGILRQIMATISNELLVAEANKRELEGLRVEVAELRKGNLQYAFGAVG